MTDLKLIFIIEEMRGIIHSITVEVSRIFKKDSQILIRRNGHDFEKLSTIVRNSDRPILESLRTCGLNATPYVIPAGKIVCYPFDVYLQSTNQFYIRRHRGGGVKLANEADTSRIPIRSCVVRVGTIEGCDIIAHMGVRVISGTAKFRYSGCARLLPFEYSAVPCKDEEGTLFIRDRVQERVLLEALSSHNIDIAVDGSFHITYEGFDELVNSLPQGFRFLTEEQHPIKSYSARHLSSGIEWFGDLDGAVSADLVDAYLVGRKYVVVGDAIIVADSSEISNAAKRAIEESAFKDSHGKKALYHLIEDLRRLDRIPELIDSCKWTPRKEILKAELKSYQIIGVRWIRALKQLKLGGVLADEMGLGKTVQLLGACAEDMLLSKKPSLIIAPASVVPNWVYEIQKFVPGLSDRIVLDPSLIEDGSLCLLSYERARLQSKMLGKMAFSHLIIDEGQKIKNAETISYQALVELSADFRMVLTGTPIENCIQELWNHVGFIDPTTLGSFDELVARYATLESVEKRNKLSLMLLSPFVLSRKKKDVLQNMPTLTEKVVCCKMGNGQRRLYEKIRKSFLNSLKKGRTVSVPSLALEALLRLRECCCHPSVLPIELNSRHVAESAKFVWVARFVEERKARGEKALLFSQFVTILNLLQRQIEGQGVVCYSLTGATRHRQHLIDAFNADKGAAVFLCSIKAGGFGINLTAASYVVLMDPWWNPAVEQQAYARAHRIGQKKNVVVYKLICEDSVEEKVLQLQTQKRILSNGIGVGNMKVSDMLNILREGV